jgi:hypothetical protein
MMHQQRGYILFITFSMLALCASIISVVMVKGLTHKKLSQALLDQQQMEQFALSTTALAQSFLSFPAPEKKDDKKDGQSVAANKATQEPVAEIFEKQLLEKVLPVVNKTQTFMMKEMEKDFPVVINLTFFCESGKININELYDLVNKKFYDEGVEGKDKKVFATWLFDKIAKLTEKPSLLQPFVEHCKQRTTPFNDVTQLLAIKEFTTCFSDTVFYERQKKKQNSDAKTKKLYLTDLFTVASSADTIQPWLLSESVCVLLDIPQRDVQQEKSQEKDDKKVDLSSFKPQADWSKDWDNQLKKIYEVGFDKIPTEVRGMFAPQFSAPVFSVIARVMRPIEDSPINQTSGMYAILQEKKLPDGSITYDVIKIYQV